MPSKSEPELTEAEAHVLKQTEAIRNPQQPEAKGKAKAEPEALAEAKGKR